MHPSLIITSGSHTSFPPTITMRVIVTIITTVTGVMAVMMVVTVVMVISSC